MLRFHIQSDSEIPASKQLFNQIQFAIASGQYPPGHRLPSTRQLAMITGLHRNTISKVYRQLEEHGLVESQAGSGIYVKTYGHEIRDRLVNPILQQYPKAKEIVKKSLDELLSQDFSLTQARDLFIWEIDWRLRTRAHVVVSVPVRDINAGELMFTELQQSLEIAVQLVPLEELSQTLGAGNYGTVVTSRYFIGEALAAIDPEYVQVIAIDIYDYAKELEIVKHLPKDACLGIVSLSKGTLGVAENIVYSLRGQDLLIMTAQASDLIKLNILVRSAHTIISDPASYLIIKEAISAARYDLIRPPELIKSENYIGTKSIELLKRELGLGS
jgi:GntR family transcriptional regulator